MICASIDHGAHWARFGRVLDSDVGSVLRYLRLLGMMERNRSEDRLTETGAIWVRRTQTLFSLNGIDKKWKACDRDAGPNSVAVT